MVENARIIEFYVGVIRERLPCARDAVLEIVDPNVLKQVIDELDGIDFRKLGPDVKGDIFEYLLTVIGN